MRSTALRATVGRHALRAFLLGAAVLLTASTARRITPMEPDAECCDHLFYRSLAFNLLAVTRPDLNTPPPGNRLWEVYEDPYYGRHLDRRNALNRQPPYCYRLLTPLLARATAWLTGGSIERGFYVVSFAAQALACFVLGLGVEQLSGTPLASVAAMVAFARIGLFEFHFHDFMLADPVAFFTIMLAVYAIVTERDRLCLAITAVGVLNKEVQLFVLPCLLLRRLRQGRMTPTIALGTIAIVAGYLALRATFPVPVRTFTLANTFARIPRVADVARGLFEVFGVLAIAAATRALYPGAPLWLLPMVAAGIGIASFTKDTARAYVYAFPFVFLCTFGRRTPGWAGRLATAAPAALFVLQMTRPAAGTPVVALALLNEAVLAAVTRARQGRLVADEAVN